MPTSARESRTALEARAEARYLASSARYLAISDGAHVRVLDFAPREDTGAEPILLVPGFASVFDGWHDVVAELVRTRRVLYFESREKASSRLPAGGGRGVTLHRMARDLAEAVALLGLEDGAYVTLSSSTGGTIQIEALSEGWMRPTAAVLVGPAVEHRISRLAAFGVSILPTALQRLALPLHRLYLRTVNVKGERHPEQVAKYMRAAAEVRLPRIRALMWEMTRTSSWDRLPRIATPCLIVGAADDGMHAKEDSRRVHAAIRGSRYVELADNRETHGPPLVLAVTEYLAGLRGEHPPPWRTALGASTARGTDRRAASSALPSTP